MKKIVKIGFAAIALTSLQACKTNEKRNIAVVIGEECEVLQTNAPKTYLEKLKNETVENCKNASVPACIPDWNEKIQKDGYESESLNLAYFKIDEIKMSWLQNEYQTFEEYDLY